MDEGKRQEVIDLLEESGIDMTRFAPIKQVIEHNPYEAMENGRIIQTTAGDVLKVMNGKLVPLEESDLVYD